jgi:hypothetical protein
MDATDGYMLWNDIIERMGMIEVIARKVNPLTVKMETVTLISKCR